MKAACIATALWLGLAFAGGPGAQAGTLHVTGLGAGSFAVPVISLREARFATTTRQQFDYSCGSAAVATLLSYHYNYPVTEQAVFEDMFALGEQDKIRKEGFSLLDIKSYLGRNGFAADAYELPLQKLLDSGLPAMVLVSEKGYNHFVVVKGLQDGRVLIGDPSSGTRALSRDKFDAIWQRKLLFVIHNKQNQARFNNITDWQVAPRASLAAGLAIDSASTLPWSKLGPGDF